MDFIFSFNKYKKNLFFHFWLLASAWKILCLPENNGFAGLPNLGAAALPAPVACMPVRVVFLLKFHLTYGMSPAIMVSRSITCDPWQVNTPQLNPSQRPVLDLITLEGWKAELTWLCVKLKRALMCLPEFLELLSVPHCAIFSSWYLHSHISGGHPEIN